MAGLRLVLVALVLTVAVGHAGDSLVLNKQYVLNDKTATWNEAKRLCEAEGQTLATVMSANDQGLLRTALRKKGGKVSDVSQKYLNAGILDTYWIGATNVGCQGSDFCWLGEPSSPVTYSDWGMGLLNILSIFNTEKCVKVWSHEGHWFDIGCDLRLKYACEYYE